MVSALATLGAVPLLALTACGDSPDANGNAAARTRMVAGVSMPGGVHRVYECNAALATPANDTLRTLVGEGPLPILLLRAEDRGHAVWAAGGHLDKAVHRTADPLFAASAQRAGQRTILAWNVHSSRVVASLEWRSPAESRAVAEFDVTDPSGTGRSDLFPYQMRGDCIENPRHPLASPPGRKA